MSWLLLLTPISLLSLQCFRNIEFGFRASDPSFARTAVRVMQRQVHEAKRLCVDVAKSVFVGEYSIDFNRLVHAFDLNDILLHKVGSIEPDPLNVALAVPGLRKREKLIACDLLRLYSPDCFVTRNGFSFHSRFRREFSANNLAGIGEGEGKGRRKRGNIRTYVEPRDDSDDSAIRALEQVGIKPERTLGGKGGARGSISTLLCQGHVFKHQQIRNEAGYKKETGEDGKKPIRSALTAFVLLLVSLVLALLSFYFAESAIDDEGVINIWRICLAISLFLVAHVPGYLSLSFWGL